MPKHTLALLGLLLATACTSSRDLASDLDAPELSVRIEAAQALRDASPDIDEALPALLQALNDSDQRSPKVMVPAIQAIGLMGDKAYQATPRLTELLARHGTDLGPLSLRHEAAIALGRIGATNSIPTLIECLKREWQHAQIRKACGFALRKLSPQSVVPLLVLCDRPGKVAEVAALIVASLPLSSQKTLIRALNKSPSAKVRAAALAALGRQALAGSRSARRAVEDARRHKDRQVAAQARKLVTRWKIR